MKNIEVKNQTIQVDDFDFDHLSKYTWCINNKGYATAAVKSEHSCVVMMHHLVMGYPPPGQEIHHIDGNKLNNQRSNLKFVSRSYNQLTKGKGRNNKTGYKGVSFDKTRGKFIAHCSHSSVGFIGRFDTPEAAATAYDKRLQEIGIEEVYMNFPK